MFQISSSTCYSKTTVKTFATFIEAQEYAQNQMKATCFEVDEDYENCADFIAAGEVYSIEPIGFKVAA